MFIQRKIIHIDMDCFYAAIEMRDFPDIASRPIAVGGDPGRRGVITTCNYAARQFGVRSAMPSRQAMKLCPDLVLQPVRMAVYRDESRYIRDIFAQYTDLIEPLSLDEAYLDVTNSNHCQGSATWIAKEIREKIYQSRELTASAGVAPNKILAKIASDWNKPNGQMVIRPEDIEHFIKDLPVRKLFGVGPKMEERLHSLGIQTCSDLQQYSQEELIDKFSAQGLRLYELSRGIDERPVNPERVRKSISVEETYTQDLRDVESCFNELPVLLQRLEARIKWIDEFSGIHNMFIKLKFNDFSQTTVERITNSIDLELIKQLINEGYKRKQKPVRLIGIGIKIKQDDEKRACQLLLSGL